MITKINNWLKARRKRLAERARRRGYGWAAVAILCDGHSASYVERIVYCHDEDPMDIAFSMGAYEAMKALIEFGACVDDRVGI